MPLLGRFSDTLSETGKNQQWYSYMNSHLLRIIFASIILASIFPARSNAYAAACLECGEKSVSTSSVFIYNPFKFASFSLLVKVEVYIE
jgi:hypothetical protein